MRSKIKPYFEHLLQKDGVSWQKAHRRLNDGIPFHWHHHPQMELTLTLNCRGQRFIGDSADSFDDGDLVLVGPNLPHSWVSNERIDAKQPFIALVVWFERSWLEKVTETLVELSPLVQFCACAQRGLSFSPNIRRSVRSDFKQLFELSPQKGLFLLLDILS